MEKFLLLKKEIEEAIKNGCKTWEDFKKYKDKK